MGNLQDFEKVPHYATKWILGSNIKYRNRLLSLGILPLSLYVEMHDLRFLFSMRNGDYDIEETSDKIDPLENTRQIKNQSLLEHRSRSCLHEL